MAKNFAKMRQAMAKKVQVSQPEPHPTEISADVETISPEPQAATEEKEPVSHAKLEESTSVQRSISRPPALEPEGQIIRVPIEEVYAEVQVRPEGDFENEETDGMDKTFDLVGVLQPPRCYPRDKRGYRIWMGETRLRKLRAAGETEIDIYVGKPPKDDKVRILGQMIENIQRANLKPLATGRGIKELIDKWKMTSDEIADALGKNKTWVSKHLSLVDAPEHVVSVLDKDVMGDNVTADLELVYNLTAVNRLDESKAKQLVEEARKNGLTRAAVKEVLDGLKNRNKENGSSPAAVKPVRKKKSTSVVPIMETVAHQVIVRVGEKEGLLLTDKLPDYFGYLWVKVEDEESCVRAEDVTLLGVREA